MQVLGKKKAQEFAKKHSDCKKAVNSLILEIESSNWTSPTDITSRYPKASIIGDSNVVFNLCGNKYRIWMKIAYRNGIVIIIKIGTHKDYDKWEIK
jgi:mRNA interferase HigB